MLTGQEIVFLDLGLPDRGEKEGHDGREVGRELLAIDAREDGPEDVAALLEARSVGDSHRLERRPHKRLVERPEHLLADRLREGADRVLGNSTKVELLSLLDQRQERNDPLHRGLEVGRELGLGGVGGGSDGADDGALERERSRLEKREKRLHEAWDVRLNVAAEDFEEAVEGGAGRSLSLGVDDELRDDLRRGRREDERRVEIGGMTMMELTGRSIACCLAHSSSSIWQRQPRALQAAFRTMTSGSLSPF
jgi:hypothetical protein